MRKVVVAGAAAGMIALVSGLGCTALLGDFEVGPSSSSGNPVDGATPDTSTVTDGGGSDAPADAQDAQAPFTACGIGPTRVIEETPDPASAFAPDGTLHVFRAGTNAVRVVAQRMNAQGALVYSFDPRQGPQGSPVLAQKLDLSAKGIFFDVRRRADGLVLLYLTQLVGAPVSHLTVYEAADAVPTNAAENVVSADFPTPQNGNARGALSIYQTAGEYFWAYSTPQGTGALTYDLTAGHRTTQTPKPTPTVIYTGEERDTRPSFLARSGNVLYLFNDRGPEGAGDRGASYFPIPETPNGPVPIRPLSPPGSKPFITLTASGVPTGPGLLLAGAEVDFSAAGGSPGQIRAGLVPDSQLSMLDSTKVAPGFTLGTLLEAPLGGQQARFFGDELVWIGTPPDPQRGMGLNFLWYNIKDRAFRTRKVGADRLAPDHRNIQRATVAFASVPNAVTADLDLVFTEVENGVSRLVYTQINCVR